MCTLTTVFLFVFKAAMLIGMAANFFRTLSMPHLKHLSWTPELPDRNKCAPCRISSLQFVYMEVELWANHMG